MPILIKRYQNRKLYNTQAKKYITLEELEELIKRKQDIVVIDNKTKQDITATTLSQIIFESEKNRSGFLPSKLLLSLVQSGGDKADELWRNVIQTLGLFHLYDNEMNRKIVNLENEGEITKEIGEQLRKKLLHNHHLINENKEDLDERIKKYLNDLQIPTKNDLEILIQKIDDISDSLDELYPDIDKK